MLRGVLFDLGGVLTPDPWQTILLTAGRGLVDSLGLDRSLVEQAGDALWPKYSRAPHSEDEYWTEFAAAIGTDIPRQAVEEIKDALIVGNPTFRSALADLETAGVRWGVISDNTQFWYAGQLRRLGIQGRVTEDLEFLSFRHGLSKTGTEPSLFDLAAAVLDPSLTLVVDDREKNIDAATATGFVAEHYAMRDDEDGSMLLDLLRRRVGI
jgi:FMN phosphatase YigB (HAD superfamily)